MADVFLSYASEDRETAQRIAEGLDARGVSVWWDRDLYAGSDFAAEIQRELENSTVIVVLWSAASVVSPWVRDEAAFARDNKHLIPLRIDSTEPPLGFRQLHTLELGRWNGDGEARAFVSLGDSVRHALGSPVSPPRAQLVPTKPNAKRHRIVAIGAALIIAALLASLTLVYTNQQGTDALVGRVGIQPFVTLADDRETQRVARAMGSEMLSLLAANDVDVVPLDRAVEADGRSELTLRGEIDRDETDFIAKADVVHAATDTVLWSLSMRRARAEADAFGVQFGTIVADGVRCAIDYRHYLQDLESPQLLRVLIRYCATEMGMGPIEQLPILAEQIVELAPSSAGAYAFCAGANAWMTRVGAIKKPAGEVERLRTIASDCAERAIDLDPNFFSPYFALAVVDDPARSIAERERLLRKSIDLNPGFHTARHQYARLLENVGRVRESHVHYERLATAFPHRFWTQVMERELAMSAAELGRFDLTRPEFERITAIWPESEGKGQWQGAESWWGDPEIARKLVPYQEDITPDTRPCFDAFIDARSSGKRMSEREIESACRRGFHVRAEEIYGYFGHVDAALRELRAHATEDAMLASPVAWHHYTWYRNYMRPVWSDARFIEVTAIVGYPQYWLETDQWPDFCATKDLPYDCKVVARRALKTPTDTAP